MLTTLQKVILESQDLTSFLQRIITQDTNLCLNSPKLSTICNPYGKVTHLFWIQIGKKATIWIDNTLIESFLKTIRYYDPFSEISIALDQSDVPITDLIENHSQDPWPLLLIKKKLITLTPETQNSYTPHILGLDDIAISYTKGCFIGHEPISRTHFKGRVKRKLSYLTSTEKPKDAINLYFHDNLYHYLAIQTI